MTTFFFGLGIVFGLGPVLILLQSFLELLYDPAQERLQNMLDFRNLYSMALLQCLQSLGFDRYFSNVFLCFISLLFLLEHDNEQYFPVEPRVRLNFLVQYKHSYIDVFMFKTIIMKISNPTLYSTEFIAV